LQRFETGRDISTVAELMGFRVIPFMPWRLIANRIGADIVIGRPTASPFMH
jgi:hypothetical protein